MSLGVVMACACLLLEWLGGLHFWELFACLGRCRMDAAAWRGKLRRSAPAQNLCPLSQRAPAHHLPVAWPHDQLPQHTLPRLRTHSPSPLYNPEPKPIRAPPPVARARRRPGCRLGCLRVRLPGAGVLAGEAARRGARSFYDKDAPIYTMSRFLPPSKVQDAEVTNSVLGDGCVIRAGTSITHSVIGLRSLIGERCKVRPRAAHRGLRGHAVRRGAAALREALCRMRSRAGVLEPGDELSLAGRVLRARSDLNKKQLAGSAVRRTVVTSSCTC